LYIQGDGNTTTDDVYNIIMRNIRTRGTADDGFRVAFGAHDIILDHVSVVG